MHDGRRCGVRRVQLAVLFPTMSPGNLGRGALQDLPSRAAGTRTLAERRQSGASASTSQACSVLYGNRVYA